MALITNQSALPVAQSLKATSVKCSRAGVLSPAVSFGHRGRSTQAEDGLVGDESQYCSWESDGNHPRNEANERGKKKLSIKPYIIPNAHPIGGTAALSDGRDAQRRR